MANPAKTPVPTNNRGETAPNKPAVRDRPGGDFGQPTSKPAAFHVADNKPVSRMEMKPANAETTQQAIAEAAYFLWMRRGGDHMANWLEAEASLRRTRR